MGYRSDQGRHARMFAFWSLTLLCLFGCTWLHDILSGFDSMASTIGDIKIPIVGIELTGAFLSTLLLFAALTYAVHLYLSRPKVADMLIDTESELRKVTWPTFDDVVNSSFVVVVSVVLLGAFLAGADWILHRIAQILILGGTA